MLESMAASVVRRASTNLPRIFYRQLLPFFAESSSTVGPSIPRFSFGASMELMAVPKKKVSPHKKGLRNGPKALKPIPVIVRCTCLTTKHRCSYSYPTYYFDTGMHISEDIVSIAKFELFNSNIGKK